VNMTDGEIEVRLILPNRWALQEVQRGGHTVLKDLDKKEKSLADAELSTADIRARRKVWEGLDGEEGVLGQLAAQMSVFDPAQRLRLDSDTRDMFDESPVNADPSPPAPRREPVAPAHLRDELARMGVYVPAAAIARWPEDLRLEAEDWISDSNAAFSAGGVVPDRPSWLLDYPLPEHVVRTSDGALRAEKDGGAAAIHDPVEWLEEVAAGEIAQMEIAALNGAHPDQPWVTVDVGYGEGLDRWQVMHRWNRERRRVDAAAVLPTNGDETRAAHAGDSDDPYPSEWIADAYAMLLSTAEPWPPPSLAGDIEAGAKVLRRRLEEEGFCVRLAAILAWTAEERLQVAAWLEGEDARHREAEASVARGEDFQPDLTEPPLFVRQAAVGLDAYADGVLHPDADFDAELRAQRGKGPVPLAVTTDSAPEGGAAPAHVVSLLEKAGRRVPLSIVSSWSDGDRDEVATWASSVIAGARSTDVSFPGALRALSWAEDAERPGAFYVSEPAPVLVLVGKRKPIRVLDESTGRFYGDDWGHAQAEHVRGRWAAGMSADVDGVTLEVRDPRVLLEDIPTVKRARAAAASA
jgi:hypothetical protein